MLTPLRRVPARSDNRITRVAHHGRHNRALRHLGGHAPSLPQPEYPTGIRPDDDTF